MNRKTIIITSVILLALIGGGIFALARNTGMHDNMGEEHDRMFLSGMIAHHQGAIDMANLALKQAKHSELKTMAQNIISTQNKEISKMESWQKNWGYPASSGTNMTDHSAMGMENDMAGMTNQLKDLSGDAFDKKFLELMIEHHQSAIDMARPVATNAKHDEVKTLAQDIITAQTKEIGQMQRWQTDWGL